jgi:RHS repeat-associated protein
VDHFNPQVLDANDYYPFGSLEPGRTYAAASVGSYRFGFNGKEDDNEVKGVGDQQDYGMRIYDPRVGRFLSLDPLTKRYAGLTPYQFSSNSPLSKLDIDGLEGITFQQIADDPAEIIPALTEWDNLKPEAMSWVRMIDENLNPLYIATKGVYEITTGKDWTTGERVDRVRTATDLGVNILMTIALHKTLKSVSSEDVAGNQATANKAAMGKSRPVASTTDAAPGAIIEKPKIDFEALYQKYKAQRPHLSQSTINKAWENAKDADGNVYDPNTGEQLTWDKFKSRYDQWHMGHKAGQEYRTLLEQLRKGQITEDQFKKEYNNPNNYQPEAPKANMSHRYEQKTTTQPQTQTQSGG